MNCFFCKGELTSSTTTHVVTLDKCIIIVKNVPCTRCVQCGETFYADETAQQLEKIVETARRNVLSEVTILDYLRAA